MKWRKLRNVLTTVGPLLIVTVTLVSAQAHKEVAPQPLSDADFGLVDSASHTPVLLGESVDTIATLLGPADSQKDLGASKGGLFQRTYDGMSMIYGIDVREIIGLTLAKPSRFVTRRNIGIGSSVSSVVAAYGPTNPVGSIVQYSLPLPSGDGLRLLSFVISEGVVERIAINYGS